MLFRSIAIAWRGTASSPRSPSGSGTGSSPWTGCSREAQAVRVLRGEHREALPLLGEIGHRPRSASVRVRRGVGQRRPRRHGSDVPGDRGMGIVMPRAEVQLDVWLVTPPGQHECHIWYRGVDGALRRICDDSLWPDGKRFVASRARRRTHCPECRALFLDDRALGARSRVNVLTGDSVPW